MGKETKTNKLYIKPVMFCIGMPEANSYQKLSIKGNRIPCDELVTSWNTVKASFSFLVLLLIIKVHTAPLATGWTEINLGPQLNSLSFIWQVPSHNSVPLSKALLVFLKNWVHQISKHKSERKRSYIQRHNC